MKIKQPLRIKFNGTKFVRVKKHVDLGGGISEGPWYIPDTEHIVPHPRLQDSQDVWLPDLNFTHGSAKVPFAMHYLPGVQPINHT